MHAQQATREAEMQQLALAETLQQALAQLGIDLTPGKPSPLLTPLPAGVWWDVAVWRASVAMYVVGMLKGCWEIR